MARKQIKQVQYDGKMCFACHNGMVKGTDFLWHAPEGIPHMVHYKCYAGLTGIDPATFRSPEPTPTPPINEFNDPEKPTPPIVKFDDSEMRAAIEELQTRVDGVVNGIGGLGQEILKQGERLNELQGNIPQINMIKLPDNPTPIELDEQMHELFPKLLKLVNMGLPIYTWGLPGGGKSHACLQVARALGLQFGYVALEQLSSPSTVYGYRDATGTYQGTDFQRCWEHGGIMVVDELDNASDSILTSLNGAIEQGICAFPHETIERHKDCHIVSSGNTNGRGGGLAHAGRRPFDHATLDRFAFIEWTYDSKLECSVTKQINTSERATTWLKRVQKIRKAVQLTDGLVVSPRASYRGAKWLRFEENVRFEELDETLIFKGLNPDLKANILKRAGITS